MSVLSRFGDGYTVTLRIGGENPDLEGVSQFIKSLFPTAVLKVLFCFIAPSAISLYLTITRRQLKPTFYMTYLCYLPVLSLPICMPACLTTWLSFGLTVCLVSAYLHACVCLSACLCLSVFLSVCRSVGLSVCLCVCVSLSLPLSLSLRYLPTYLLTFFTL